MLPASNRGPGQNLGFPDVCLTPAGPAVVPIPYPNIATNSQATGFSTTVKIENMNALILSSIIPKTSGDESGTAHAVVMQKGAYTLGNLLIYIEKQQAINLTSLTTGNAANNPIGAVVVPSAATVFFTYASAEAPPVDSGDVTAEHLSALGEAVRGREGDVEVLRVGDALVLRLERFSSDLGTRVFRVLRGFDRSGARALVIDLRGCPGGDRAAFIELSGDFLPQGALIASIDEGDDDPREIRALRDGPYAMPLAVLVDGKTASAAELFAACMKATGRGVIVGERTYGKAAAQRVTPSADRSRSRYATVARCRPAGLAIESSGLAPDVLCDPGDPSAIEVSCAAALARI